MRAKQLAKAECCNYFRTGPYGIRDHCLIHTQCLLVTGSSTRCRWFTEAVAPQDDEARDEYEAFLAGEVRETPKPTRRARCKTCGEKFETTSNRAQYCSKACLRAAQREQSKACKRRNRTHQLPSEDTSQFGSESIVRTTANPHS